MEPLDILDESIAITHGIIDAAPITDADRSSPTPCADFTVDQLVDHIIDTHVFLITAAGGEADPNGSIGERHAAVGRAATDTWRRRGIDGTIDLGGNELPASFGLSLHALEAFVHGWDLAEGLGRPFEPNDQLVDAALDLARNIISDEMRGDFDGAPYGAAVEVVDGDQSSLAVLIAHAGRRPLPRTVDA
jgi:uncharacterized protein (TIGR03086 family)